VLLFELLFIALAIVAATISVVAVKWLGAPGAVRPAVMAAVLLTVLGGVFAWWHVVRRRRHRRIVDPVFGVLDRDPHMPWVGWHEFEERIMVSIFAGDEGPRENQRQLFIEFKRRFEEMRAAVERPLFDEYQACREACKAEYEASDELRPRFESDFPFLQNPTEIWSIAHLSHVEIQGDDQIDLALTYSIDWADDDHDLSAHVWNWKVVEVGKEG
jgi:hypothetical protein